MVANPALVNYYRDQTARTKMKPVVEMNQDELYTEGVAWFILEGEMDLTQEERHRYEEVGQEIERRKERRREEGQPAFSGVATWGNEPFYEFG